MTDWEKFKESPWKADHRSFQQSDLAVRPAPEYASSEVLLSALYRRIGLGDVGEKNVPVNGRDLLRRVEAGKAPPASALRSEEWSRVLQGSLESPKLPNQSAKRFLQLTPLVPEVSRYSGSARLAGNPWSPGDLIERMVLLGSTSKDQADALWQRVFAALSVTSEDDVWARWVESELTVWRQPSGSAFSFRPLERPWPADFFASDARSLQFPARQFVKDLDAVISVKAQMTRRQWASLLESVLRIASVAHVMWLSDVTQRVWSLVRGSLRGDQDFTGQASAQGAHSIYPQEIAYFPYGRAAMDQAKVLVSRYLYARLGLNATLWGLEEIGQPFLQPLSSQTAVDRLVEVVASRRDALRRISVLETWQALQDTESRTLSCSKGIGSNMLEFVRHCVGQRQTARDVLRGYDQGYSIRKRTNDARARWVVGLGPVAVIAMAHCCLHETGGARSVHRLCDHLARYGILIGRDEVASSDLGQKLRLLGLVLDSPDAESGMLVLPPFPRSNAPRTPVQA
ncbi:hypothetical protein D621_02800 [beta proteobacterium AAP51]|nr:hypothetical protein D621_02800 [beta proteobacterium AAP51]